MTWLYAVAIRFDCRRRGSVCEERGNVEQERANGFFGSIAVLSLPIFSVCCFTFWLNWLGYGYSLGETLREKERLLLKSCITRRLQNPLFFCILVSTNTH